MCLSLVSTIQPRRPASVSQISSWVSCGKCSSWVVTSSPACRSAFGIIFRPRDRSMKKIGDSGSKGEFTTNSLFDLRSFAAVIVGQFVYRLTCFVTFGYDIRGDASACDNGTAKRDVRINDNIPGLVECPFTSKRIKSDCQAG